MSFKSWMKDVWNFINYIVTEPFIELWKLIYVLIIKRRLMLPKTWMTVFFVLMCISYLMKNANMFSAFMILLMISIIAYYWEMGEWRRRERLKLYKTMEENKDDKQK